MNNIEKIKNIIQNDEFINLIRPYFKEVECYLVGGFLRDLATGEISHDRDLIVKSDVHFVLSSLMYFVKDVEWLHILT